MNSFTALLISIKGGEVSIASSPPHTTLHAIRLLQFKLIPFVVGIQRTIFLRWLYLLLREY